ncbi:permease [Fodinicola feengrottensis]|uniref:Permease n=1 Tax=Fodinicola feengrottensis TaxID=435914 RepID=A0ABP4VH04_9ACTN
MPSPEVRTLEPTTDEPSPEKSPRPWSLYALILVCVGIVAFRGLVVGAFTAPIMQTWATVFVSIVVQATPFLVLGVLISAGLAVLVPPDFFARVLPSRAVLAVPVAGVAGMVLPGCECGSVPIAGGLMRRGVAPAAALAFLLSAPAINPIVLVATAVAFPGQPMMVVARFTASVLTSVAMGWLWLRIGRPEWIRLPRRAALTGMPRWQAFLETARADFLPAGGFLVVGGLTAATLNVLVPASVLATIAHNPVLAVVGLAVLAVVLSICSEADAFVAASLTQFSLTARLVFLVVGPMIDLKLFAMQAGAFSRAFAVRFAPATFVVAIIIGTGVGLVLL